MKSYIIYLLKKIKQYIIIYKNMFLKSKKILINENKKQAYILFGADYCNLGDIAITTAQKRFLTNILDNNYEIIIINNEDTFKVFLDFKKKINKDSFVTFIGGGNHGDIYDFIDFKRRYILKKIKKCKIISFPQTIVYSETFDGNKKLNEFVNNARKNKNFYLFARENNTFKKYKNLRIENTYLVPDIVFSLDNKIKKYDRNGIGLVFRDDNEKSLSIDFQNKLISDLKEKNEKYEMMDTCGYDLKLDDYNNFLYYYLNKIAKKRLVITDRLHGMIFCYITNTPCIVFNNNNSKIQSTYDTWLGKQNFIILSSENDESLNEKINILLNLKEIKKEDITKYFDKLIEVFK